MITCDDTGFGAWLPVPTYSANTPNPLKEFCKPTRDLVKGIIGILCEKSTDEICLSACRCGRCRSPPNATDAAIACDRRCLCLRQALCPGMDYVNGINCTYTGSGRAAEREGRRGRETRRERQRQRQRERERER